MKLLYKSVSGLLYAKNTKGFFIEDFVIDDWTLQTAYMSKSLVGSKLQIVVGTTSVPGTAWCNAVSSQSKVFIYTNIQQVYSAIRAGVIGHVSNGGYDGVGIDVKYTTGTTYPALLRDWISGVGSTIQTLAGQYGEYDTPYGYWMYLDGSSVIGYDEITGYDWSGSSSFSSGLIGVLLAGSSYVMYVNDFIASKERYIYIYGLSTGDIVEIRKYDGTVIDTAYESGGSAIIDLYKKVMTEIDRVVVKRSSVDYAQYTIGPEVYIAGGDTYYVDENINIIENTGSRSIGKYIEYGNNIYIGGITPHGFLNISKYNKLTKNKTTTELENIGDGDSHNSPCVLIDTSGYIYVFYALHNINTDMYYYKSTNPDDISSFGSKQTISGFSATTTYSFCMQNSAGRIFVFTRVNNATNNNWYIAYSDDGVSWTIKAFLNSTIWTYMIPRQSSTNQDVAIVAITYLPFVSTYHDIYAVKVDLSTGDVYKPGVGTPISNFYSSAFTSTNALKVFTYSSSNYAWVDDINEDGGVFYTKWDPASPDTTGIYCFKQFDVLTGAIGSESEIVSAGTPYIYSAGSRLSFARGAFISQNKVILAREVGGEHYVEIYTYSGGSWSAERIDSDNGDNILCRRIPFASQLYNSDSTIFAYSRTKSFKEDDFIGSNDIVIVDITSSGSSTFGASITKTFVNVKVYFYSTGSGTSYTWYFGDGITSTVENPIHSYSKAGVYIVKLFVDGIEHSNTITIIVFEKSFILDAGAVYINYGERSQMLLGATEGGNQFGIDQDFRHMLFDGKHNEIIKTHRIVGVTPKIIANFIEINYRLLNIAIPGSNITFNSNSVMIKRAISKLLDSDYIKNVAIVAEHGGNGCLIVFKILNSISVENLEIQFEDDKESVIEVTFAGCFTRQNNITEPWEIEFLTYN